MFECKESGMSGSEGIDVGFRAGVLVEDGEMPRFVQ